MRNIIEPTRGTKGDILLVDATGIVGDTIRVDVFLLKIYEFKEHK